MADASEIVATIASRMQMLRTERKLSLQEVADRTGLSKSHVWELEQGRSRNPTIETAVRIATALGVSLDYLTGLSSATPSLHPEAMRIACEVDALLRCKRVSGSHASREDGRSPAEAEGWQNGGKAATPESKP